MRETVGKTVKKLVAVSMVFTMGIATTGCSLFDTFKTKEEDTKIRFSNSADLKNNKAYIWHNKNESDIRKDLDRKADCDVYFQCIKGDINFKGEEEYDTYGNGRSIWISGDEDGDIPTLTEGDRLIYISDDSVPDTIRFERFADYGYSIGVSNLMADEGGHYYFPYEETEDEEYKMYIDMKSDAKDITELDYVSKLYLDKVGDISVNEESVSAGGTVLGLENGKKYVCEFYTGTYYQDFEMTAGIHTFSSFEAFYSHDYEFLHSNCIAIEIPDYFVSGYYFVNGVGMFRYVTEEDAKVYNGESYDENIDWNKPLIIYDENGMCIYDPGNPDAVIETEECGEDSDAGMSGYIRYEELAELLPVGEEE